MPELERPTFWIVAGPNGSGKSSLYGNTDIEAFDQSVWIINPDLLTKRIQDVEGLALGEANIQAVTRIEVWLDASISAHQTVGVETVLSTAKYRRLVTAAKQRQFQFRLLYVMLSTPEMNIQRVRLRVIKGGHAVPEDKIRERWHKSLEQLPWFLNEADQAAIYDNSGSVPRLIGQKSNGVTMLDPSAPRPLQAVFHILIP